MLTIRNEKTKLKKFGKFQKRQYLTRNYANPYFQQKRPAAKINQLALPSGAVFKLLFLVFAAGLFLLVWWLLYSPHFMIRNITVNNEIDSEQVSELAWQQTKSNFFALLPQKNLFLYNRNVLAEQIRDQLPIDEIKIDKKIPDTIIINFKLKKQLVFWLEDGKYYRVDAKGSLISEINPIDINKNEFPLIENLSANKISNGKISVSGAVLDFTSQLLNKINSNHGSIIKIDKFLVDNDYNTVKLTLMAGPQVFFNVNENIDKQIQKLLTVLNTKTSDELSKKIYIDVRVGDAIYIR